MWFLQAVWFLLLLLLVVLISVSPVVQVCALTVIRPTSSHTGSSTKKDPNSHTYTIATRLRREERWDAAVSTLEASTDTRRRFDHRAHLARLIGIYVGEQQVSCTSTDCKAEILVAMQPDQGGRKLLFLNAVDGRSLGFIELETQSAISKTKIRQTDIDIDLVDLDPMNSTMVDTINTVAATSALRGMLVNEDCRGKGYARLFLAIWLKLCSQGGVTPATTRINKPLLALTLVRLGFTPLRGHHLAVKSHETHLRDTNKNTNTSMRDDGGSTSRSKNENGKRRPRRKKLKEKQRPLAVEVSIGTEGRVLLYSPVSTERLRNGFSATEVTSQRLVVATEPSVPRGRVAHLRVRYSPPPQQQPMPMVHSNLHTDSIDEPQLFVSSSLLLETNNNSSINSNNNIVSGPSSQMVHAPLAEGVGGRLRLSAWQGPAGDPHPPATATTTIEEQTEAIRILLTGRI